MLGFLVNLANFVITFVVNLLLVGVGTVAGLLVGLLITLTMAAILSRISLRWCHARVVRSDADILTSYGMREFTYKDVHNREMRCLKVYAIILLAMLATFAYAAFGGMGGIRYYIGPVEGLHIMYMPLAIYLGVILILPVTFLADIHEQGRYHFDVTEKDGEKVLILTDGSGFSALGITLDDKGKFVSV